MSRLRVVPPLRRVALVLRVSLALSLLSGSPARADLPWTRIDGVFPPGAQAGTTTTVRIVGGAEIDAGEDLAFSHPGIAAAIVPATGSEAGRTYTVTVAPDVPTGLYDVRVLGELGLSNARTFAVGTRAEQPETEPNDTPAEAAPTTIGTTLNGVIQKPTDIDSWTFEARQGERIIADCLAQRIDSPLLPVLELLDARGRRVAQVRSGREGDATLVFQPATDGKLTLRVYDQTYRGGESFVYRVQLHADTHVVATSPLSGAAGQDGDVAVFAVGLPGGTPTARRWGQWPLDEIRSKVQFPQDRFTYDHHWAVTPRQAGMDSFAWPNPVPPLSTMPLRMHLGDEPSREETEPNDGLTGFQRLALPADISGNFELTGDVDEYRFAVRKGDPVWIEVFGDRIGSRADVVMTVDFIATAGTERKRLASIDDTPVTLVPLAFETRTDDPQYRLDPPEDGECLIRLRDQYGQTRGDATLFYRLVVRTPRPDFRLVALPLAMGTGAVAPQGMRRGDAFPFSLVAFRHDGFDGPISILATELAPGLRAEPTLIPAGQTTAPLVLRSRFESPPAVTSLNLIGRAEVAASEGSSKILERQVRPATTIRSTEKVAGRDNPASVRLARDFLLSVTNEAAPLELRVEATRMTVAQGRLLTVPVEIVRRGGADGPVTVTAVGIDPAWKMELSPVTFAPGETRKSMRWLIRPDAPPRTTVFTLTAKTNVKYRRHRNRLDEALATLAEQQRLVGTAGASRKLAEAALADADKALVEASRTSNPPADAAPLEAARSAADKRLAEAIEQQKVAEAELAKATAAVAQIESETPVRELEDIAVSSPLILDVQPAPVAITVDSPDVLLTRGQTARIKFRIARQIAFTGGCEVSLAAPSMPSGVTADPVLLAPDVSTGELLVKAAEDAPPGGVADASLRVNCEGTLIDAPIQLKVPE